MVLSADTHVTKFVTEEEVSSLYIAVAVNCSDWPFANSTVAGVTWISLITASVTVKFNGLLSRPSISAVMIALPNSLAESKPSSVTAAIVASVDVHFTKFVSGYDVPSV